MDNKYQEALDNLIAIERERTFRRIGTFFHTNCDTLQELVDKETPKRVKPFPNSFYIKICPNCGSTLETKRNYCDECGQKLDWSKK